MAYSFNNFVGMGYLAADPEVRSMGSGKDVANFRVGITERWGSGRDQDERTEWVNCVAFNDQLVDVVDKYLNKGDPVHFQGKMQTRKWQDRDGNDRYTTEIVVFSIQLLGTGGSGDRDRGGRGDADRRDRGDDRGRGERGSGDRGRDRGRDDGGRDRGRGDDRRSASSRDDRGGSRRDDRDRDTRGGGRSTQADRDLDDEIPF